MATHETVRKMTDGQRNDLIATMVGAVPDDLSFDEAKAITGDKGSLVADIREVFEKRRNRMAAVPADDEEFELEVDDDIDPMGVVRTAGYDPKNWKYLGPKLNGKPNYQVKLIRFGYVRNLEEARKRADERKCRLLEGQAREPFKKKFQRSDGKGPIVFGGSGWQDPRGNALVSYLNDFKDVYWSSDFDSSEYDFNERCRWAVVSK